MSIYSVLEEYGFVKTKSFRDGLVYFRRDNLTFRDCGIMKDNVSDLIKILDRFPEIAELPLELTIYFYDYDSSMVKLFERISKFILTILTVSSKLQYLPPRNYKSLSVYINSIFPDLDGFDIETLSLSSPTTIPFGSIEKLSVKCFYSNYDFGGTIVTDALIVNWSIKDSIKDVSGIVAWSDDFRLILNEKNKDYASLQNMFPDIDTISAEELIARVCRPKVKSAY